MIFWIAASSFCFIIGVVALMLTIGSGGKKSQIMPFLKDTLGLKIKKAGRLVKEVARKGFHFMGLLFPYCYYIGLTVPMIPLEDPRFPLLTKKSAILISFSIALFELCVELLRLYVPFFRKLHNKNFRWLMRESEHNEFMGMFWYVVGAFLSILLFDPYTTIVSQLFLIIGDFVAALFGTAFGKTKIVGKKSLEGSLACFAFCFACAYLTFLWVGLDPFAVLILSLSGSLFATLAELFSGSPFLPLNDNVVVPVVGGIGVTLPALLFSIAIPFPKTHVF
eukprot:GCRY01001860.1.p1 GENE.GCRY01001860.1~~GCRY01001860.1.p1  ORF type:complete len:279 (-),score=37.82 GCRY01001860.1:15-851(-)